MKGTVERVGNFMKGRAHFSMSETLPPMVSMTQQCGVIYCRCLGKRVEYFLKGSGHFSLSETLQLMVSMTQQCGMIYGRCLGRRVEYFVKEGGECYHIGDGLFYCYT